MPRFLHPLVARLVALCLLATPVAVFAQEGDDSPEAMLQNGMANFTAGRFSEAVAFFSKLVSLFGNEPSLQKQMEVVTYALGCSQYNLNDHVSAIATFDSFVQKYPASRFIDEVLFRLGASHQATEAYDKAIATFRRVLEVRPDSPFGEDALYQVAMCFVAQGRSKDVIAELQAFAERYPASDLVPQSKIHLSRAYFEQGQLAEALDALESMQGSARSLDALVYANFLGMEIGDAAFDNTDYDMALRAYRRVRTRDALIRIQRSVVQRYEAILEDLKRERVDPMQVADRFRRERRMQTQLAGARDSLAKLESAPDYDAGLFHRIGRCFFAVDRIWEARVAFARVVAEADDPVVKEAGHYDLILCLNRLRRFPELIAEADRYLGVYGADEKLVKSGRVPAVGFMRAEAFVNQELFEEAEAAMAALLETYPEHPQRPRIEFYLALSIAMQERFEESIELLRAWLEKHPDDAVRPEAEYWLPVALYYNGDAEAARPLFQDYIANYPQSVYAPEAAYRAALCLYLVENFDAAADELAAWIDENPDSNFHWEAIVTLGDALAAAGRLEEAKAAYLRLTPAAGPFYFLGLQQCVKVWRALDTEQDYLQMSRAFADFIRANPESPQIVDAAYQAGTALRQIGRTDEAQRLYWNIIERYGNNRAWEGFGPLLDGLRGLYGNTKDQLLVEAESMESRARSSDRPTLVSRLVLARHRWEDKDRGESARELMRRFPVEVFDADTLAHIGAALIATGEPNLGLSLLDRLLQEYPRSRSADVAFARKAEARLAEGNAAEALTLADQAIERAFAPELLLEATFTRAESLRALARHDEAIAAYNVVLANRVTPRALKPRAMLGIGACFEAKGDARKAIPYYQRIYVLYQAFADSVAQAYLRSASAFERLKDREAAVNTYREMLAVETLAGRPELDTARRELERLGGGA